MAVSDQFESVLHEWIGVFMRNSMRHFLQFAKARKLSLPFDRRRNKIVSAHSALDLLRRALLR